MDLINAKRSGKTIAVKPRPRGENVVDLMEALKKSIASETAVPKGKKLRKGKLLPIKGKKPSKKAVKAERSTRRKAGYPP
jgi:DNA end-binding protein Ku